MKFDEIKNRLNMLRLIARTRKYNLSIGVKDLYDESFGDIEDDFINILFPSATITEASMFGDYDDWEWGDEGQELEKELPFRGASFLSGLGIDSDYGEAHFSDPGWEEHYRIIFLPFLRTSLTPEIDSSLREFLLETYGRYYGIQFAEIMEYSNEKFHFYIVIADQFPNPLEYGIKAFDVLEELGMIPGYSESNLCTVGEHHV